MRKNEKRKRKNVGERKSRTPVMPRAGMRIEEPGQGPWCERMKKEKRKKKKKKERKNGGERKSRTPVMPRDGMRIEEPGRGQWCENEKKKKKKKGRMEEKGSPGLPLCHTVARGTWHLVVDRGAKKKRKKKEKKKGK